MRRELERFSDDELAEIFLDRDEDRWRPEVFDIVASILESRGVSTRELLAARAEELAEASASIAEAPPELLVTVAEYFNTLDAQADRLALEQAGLKVWLAGEYQGEGGTTSLQVRPGDLAAAMEILDAPPVTGSDLPDELAEAQCPRCGSHDVTEEDEEADVLDPASSSLSGAKDRLSLCRCASCGHTWSD